MNKQVEDDMVTRELYSVGFTCWLLVRNEGMEKNMVTAI